MNLFELMFRIGVEDEASSKVGQIADKVGNGLKKAAEIGAAAIGAATAGVAALTKSSIEQYAEYEQLVGGVETLFGDAADTVAENAESAFTRSGLSINNYLETVTSFSASLLQSLDGDTQAAASAADQAIVDMSDNANKMGSSIESIQNAYNGFAKGNFTMLDNLKLGYGGTKEEMERLLADAEAISGIEYDVSSYADIVEAIHVIQTEMGITGTTAKEASTTISGSFSTLQSAWTNLVTGLGNADADLGKLVGDVVASAETVVANVLPVGERILSGITTLIGKVAPLVAEKLPGLISEVLPQLLDTATVLFTGIVNALPELLTVLVNAAPTVVGAVVTSIVDLLPQIVDLGLQLLLSIASGITDNLPELVPAITEVILSIVDKITQPDTLVPLVGAALEIMVALAEGIIAAIPKLIEAVPQIIANLIGSIESMFPKIGEAGTKIIVKIIDGFDAVREKLRLAAVGIVTAITMGIVGAFTKLSETGAKIITVVHDAIKERIDAAKSWGSDLISNFIDGLKAKWESLKTTVSNIAGSIKDFLGFSEPDVGPLSDFHTYAPDMMKLFAEGIRDNEHLITDQIEKSFDFRPEIVTNKGTAQVVGSAPVSGSSGSSVNRPLNVSLVLDRKELARTVFELNNEENQRVGTSLVRGGNARALGYN